MNIDEMSKEKLLEIHECLEKTQGLGCPETKYRPKETLCFYCNKCWRIAIENKLESEDKQMNDEVRKAKPRYNKSTDSWNIFVEVGGRDIPVGTTVGELLDKSLFKTTEFNSKEDAIEWINNSPFELKEDKDNE